MGNYMQQRLDVTQGHCSSCGLPQSLNKLQQHLAQYENIYCGVLFWHQRTLLSSFKFSSVKGDDVTFMKRLMPQFWKGKNTLILKCKYSWDTVQIFTEWQVPCWASEPHSSDDDTQAHHGWLSRLVKTSAFHDTCFVLGFKERRLWQPLSMPTFSAYWL